jgi:hypothetical protein
MHTASRPLTRRLIRDHHLYRDPAFDLLVDFLIANRFRVSRDYRLVTRLIPRFDQLYWSAATPLLVAKTGGFRVDGADTLHHAMHHLLIGVGGSRLAGMPRFTLLAEALASASDIYFTLVYYRRFGADHPLVSQNLFMFHRDSKSLGRPFLRLFNRLLAAPFDAYRECVQEIFKVAQFCLRVVSTSGRDYGFADELRRLVETQKYWVLNAHLAYPTFASYVLAHCGTRSSKRDRESVRRTLAILWAARSMPELLEGLGIGQAGRARSSG